MESVACKRLLTSRRDAFEGNVILDHDAVWKSTSDFVWDAPPGFTKKSSLLHLYGNELSKLFKRILGVPNASLDDTIEHIAGMSEVNTKDLKLAIGAYTFLQDNLPRHGPKLDTFTQKCREEFSRRPLVAIPISGKFIVWKRTSECVWKTSELFESNDINLRCKAILHVAYPEANLHQVEYLFTQILGIPDAGLEEFLQELELLRKEDSHDASLIKRIYKCLAKLQYSQSNERLTRSIERLVYAWFLLTAYRSRFEKEPLIFVSDSRGKHAWLYPGQCVWAKSCLRSKASLQTLYRGLEILFRNIIGAHDITLSILVEELCRISTKEDERAMSEDFHYAKELIQACSKFETEVGSSNELTSEPCWPCRSREGSRIWKKAKEFFANDRQDLYDIFSKFVTFLDFKFEEVNRIKSFLKAAGIKFISSAVPNTRLEEPFEIDVDRKADMHWRAEYLYR